MKKLFGVLAVLLWAAGSAQAVVSLPTLYYDFDNSEGQSAQMIGNPNRFDGRVTEQIGTGLDLWLWQRNGSASKGGPASLQSLFNDGSAICGGYAGGCEGGANSAPPEHYVTGAPSTGGGSAYHFEGGIGRNYNDDNGNPGIDAQTDSVALMQNQVQQYRDNAYIGTTHLNPDPWNYAQTDSSGDGYGGPTVNGGVITYNMWLNVQKATNVQDNTRFGTGSSFVIGRGSGGSGFGGEVSLRDGDGSGATLDYKLQFRNDGGPNGIQQSAFVFNANTWHHFLVEYDLTGATGTVTLWIDGGPDAGGSKEVLTNFGNSKITGAFLMNQVAHPGAVFFESGDFFIDDLAIWQRKMTDGDASRLYNYGVTAATVPEPSSIVLSVLGLVGLGFFGWRRRSS